MNKQLEAKTTRLAQSPDGVVEYHDVGIGTPLVLIPGLGPLPGMSAWTLFEKVMYDLAETHRLIVVDLPGYGRSDPVIWLDEPAHDVYARAVIAAMDAAGVDRAPIVGVSMGGTTALDIALSRPERVESLVIASCHASTHSSAGGDPYLFSAYPPEVLRICFEMNAAPVPEKHLTRRLLTSLVHDERLISEEMIDSMFQVQLDHPECLEAVRRSRNVGHDRGDELRTIDVPVLMMHGRSDRMVPVEQALHNLHHMPQADLVILNECGHWPPFERPREFVSHVLRFLASTRPSDQEVAGVSA